MALTGTRWLAIATLGCLALAVVYWPGSVEEDPADTGPANWYTASHQARQFRSALNGSLGRGLALLQLRDQILDHLASGHEAGSPVAFRIPALPGDPASRRLAEATEQLIRLLKPTAPLIRTVVLTRSDSSFPLPSGGRVALRGTWYLMPGATNGRVCLVLPTHDDLRRSVFFLFEPTATVPQDAGSELLRALGPCAFYTAFGAPGAGIERWLRAQDYATAERPDWEHPPAPLQRVSAARLSELSGAGHVWEFLRAASSGAYELGPLNLPSRACAHGRLDQCRGVALTPFSDLRSPLFRQYAVARQWSFYREDLGGAFLSDLVRLKGREQFARFWRSDLPVDSAFTRAFGLTMDEWTQRWLLGNIEHPRFGPVVRFGSVVFGLGLVGVAIVVTGLLTMRRQVG